jgi:CheY-like chemotaxis protein
MGVKRILIVDDDETVLYMLENSLTKLGDDYQVATVSSGPQAIERVQEQVFDLVLADFMMPGITGIDLARVVRQVSPQTAVVLMTAYGTNRLKDTSKYVGVDGYLDKPFTVEELFKVLNRVTNRRQPPEGEETPAHASADQPLRKNLQNLLVNANARCVLLLNAAGKLIEVVGQADDTETAGIGEFVAVNFAAAQQFTADLSRQSTFKSSYYEYNDYNIYIYNVDDQFLLAVVFGTALKAGVVWFYTKQTAAVLAHFLEHHPGV